MKSVLHDKRDGSCFLCGMLYGDYSRKVTEEHHVFFGRGRRRLSEKYGMKVYLCLPHHRTSKEAVHVNQKNRELLWAYAKTVFRERFPDQDFYETFGKNYAVEDGRKNEETRESTGEGATAGKRNEAADKLNAVAGFTKIADGVEGLDW